MKDITCSPLSHEFPLSFFIQFITENVMTTDHCDTAHFYPKAGQKCFFFSENIVTPKSVTEILKLHLSRRVHEKTLQSDNYCS